MSDRWRETAKPRAESVSVLVGARGFEPRTSCAQGKRATRLRHAPKGETIPFCQASFVVSSVNHGMLSGDTAASKEIHDLIPEAECAEVKSGVSRTDLATWCMILSALRGEAIVFAGSLEKEEQNGSKEDPYAGWRLR